MKLVRRWDAGAVAKVERTDQGYLRCDATITRTGVFPYRAPGGKVRYELRLPEEVFNANALRSFGIAPLTNGHPRKANGEAIMLTPQNTGRYQVGSVVEPRQDGDTVAATVQVTDAEVIEEIDAGKRQLSCGYTCALEMTSGTTVGVEGIPDGTRFDAIQRDIRGNHVALVTKGRQGEAVQLRIDSADAFQVDPPEPQSEPTKPEQDTAPAAGGVRPMEAKITIDGVSFETTEQIAQAVGKYMERADTAFTELAETKTKVETERARADAAEENLIAEKQARADAADPEKLKAAVAARLTLERSAAPVLGDEVKLDELTDSEIKAAVVVEAARDKDKAKERIDGCGEEYLQARFDAALESWEQAHEPNAGLAATRKAANQATRTDSVEDARERMIARNLEIGRKAFN